VFFSLLGAYDIIVSVLIAGADFAKCVRYLLQLLGKLEPFRLQLLVSGTFYLSTSLLHLRCLSSDHTLRLIFSPFPIPIPYLVHCLRSDTFILDTLIVHLTYLLTVL